MAVERSVADDVCRLLRELQDHGGALEHIHLDFYGDAWSVSVQVSIPGLRGTALSRSVNVETYDVALAVATAVGGRYDLLKSDDTRAAL